MEMSVVLWLALAIVLLLDPSLSLVFVSSSEATESEQSCESAVDGTCAEAQAPNMNEDASSHKSVVVVGATGATGKHVVRLLVEHGRKVKPVVRSKEKLLDLLSIQDGVPANLDVIEGSIYDFSDNEIADLVSGASAIVSCLGHNGIYPKPHDLVTSVATRLYQAAEVDTKFILMSSNGVLNPSGDDRQFTTFEVAVFWLLRRLIPPHVDNENAASFLHGTSRSNPIEWIAVRPGDLTTTNEADGKYDLHKRSPRGPFSDGHVSRANVAHFMVSLVTDDKLWEDWKFEMPIILDGGQG